MPLYRRPGPHTPHRRPTHAMMARVSPLDLAARQRYRPPRPRRYSALLVAACVALNASGCGGDRPFWSPMTIAATTTSAADTTEAPTAGAQPGSTSTTTTVAQAFDYRSLLLRTDDMALPNQGYSLPEPATLNPDGIPGAEVMLTSNDSTNAVGITIVVLDDAASAPVELPKAIANIKTVVPSGPPTPVPVGDEAVALTGATPDGSQAATALMFRYDRALVRIDVYSLPGTTTPLTTVIDLGQKQTIALRIGLAAAKQSR